MELVPRSRWIIFPHLLIAHGRKICKARTPLCAECVLEKLCPSSLLKNGTGKSENRSREKRARAA
jgi:endonuclease-3